MIEECGRVVAVEADGVWVATLSRSGCGRCDEPGGCGRRSIFRLFGERQHHVHARVSPGGRAPVPGDPVLVGVPEGLVLRAALLLYLLPLLALLAGAVIGDLLLGEAGSILLGVGGLGTGFLAARVISRNRFQDPRWQPVVLGILPGEGTAHPT